MTIHLADGKIEADSLKILMFKPVHINLSGVWHCRRRVLIEDATLVEIQILSIEGLILELHH